MKQIVAFSKDWNDVPTCATHILRELSKQTPVLWINSVGTRKPRLFQARDWRRCLRKCVAGLRPAIAVENQLRVLAPLVIPKPESRVSRWINKTLVGNATRRELNGTRADMELEIWSFIPNAADYLPAFGDAKVIYYCVDDWSRFEHLDSGWIQAQEETLLKQADVVLTPSRFLQQKCQKIVGDNVFYSPHGVEYAKFASALDAHTVIPSDLAKIPGPRIGFYGNIYPWIDFELLQSMARQHREWSFIMIGPVYCDISPLRKEPNIHFLGRRDHDQLPAYCKGFDLGFIPYDRDNPRMQSVQPVKINEFLAAGVPVVCADIPEVSDISPYVVTASDAAEFGDRIASVLRDNGRRPEMRATISAEQQKYDWSHRVRQIRATVDRCLYNIEPEDHNHLPINRLAECTISQSARSRNQRII